MGAAGYIGRLRRCVGHDLLLIPSAAACIRDEEGRLLLLRRSDEEDLWGFPGGAMELGEGITQTVVREVREETGLEVMPKEQMGRWIGIISLFRGLLSIPAPLAGGLIWEHLGPQYVFLAAIAIDACRFWLAPVRHCICRENRGRRPRIQNRWGLVCCAQDSHRRQPTAQRVLPH